MEKVKNQSKKEKSIKILGPIRDRLEVIKMYQSAEVYVMPSYREGLPLTLFEAMASGCPIVASPVNGIPYEINNENGFLVNYGDDKEFANKIEKIINNKKLANKISKTNKEKAKNYDWDKIFEKTMKVYKDD
jgi:glycosyltransferase involved in cell wall biosynthesis